MTYDDLQPWLWHAVANQHDVNRTVAPWKTEEENKKVKTMTENPLKRFRCNPDVAPRLTSGGIYEEKVDVITPINTLSIGGGEFWSLMKIKLMILPQSIYIVHRRQILMGWWSQRPGWGERFKTLVPRLCNWTEIRCSPSPRRDEPSSFLHVRSLPKAPKLLPDAATSSEQHWAVFQCVAMCRNIQLPVASLEPYAKDPFDEHGLSTWILWTASRSALPVVICKSFWPFRAYLQNCTCLLRISWIQDPGIWRGLCGIGASKPVRSTQRLPGRLSLEYISYASILPISMFRAATYGWWLRTILREKTLDSCADAALSLVWHDCRFAWIDSSDEGLSPHQLAFAQRNGQSFS